MKGCLGTASKYAGWLKQMRYKLGAVASSVAALTVTVGATTALSPPAFAQSAAPQPAPRIDTPITDANSVRVDFGGAVLRVPQFLVDPRAIPADRRQAIRMNALVFTFWYPDMTLTHLLGADPAESSAASASAKSAHRVKVYVSWLVYSPDAREERTPRPSDILAGLVESIGYPQILDTPYKGLRSASFEEAFRKKFPQFQLHPQPPKGSLGHLYIQAVDSPYELHLSCDSSSCTAVMYSKSHHFHLQMTLYAPDSEVAPQADEILRKINLFVDGWVSK